MKNKTFALPMAVNNDSETDTCKVSVSLLPIFA